MIQFLIFYSIAMQQTTLCMHNFLLNNIVLIMIYNNVDRKKIGRRSIISFKILKKKKYIFKIATGCVKDNRLDRPELSMKINY